MKWCIDNEYELVELCPQRHDSDLEDEPFEEEDGLVRITQAIQAFSWPNSTFKGMSHLLNSFTPFNC